MYRKPAAEGITCLFHVLLPHNGRRPMTHLVSLEGLQGAGQDAQGPPTCPRDGLETDVAAAAVEDGAGERLQ